MSVAGAQFREFGPFTTTAGVPYSGIRLFHYAAGTSATQTAWTDEAKATPAADPIVGDTKGVASGYFEGDYHIVVKSSVADGDLTLYDWDNVKLEGKTATLRSENQGASYPAASSTNLGQMFAKTSAGQITEVGININTSSFTALRFQGTGITTTEEWAAGANLASASTLTLGSDGNSFLVTGTTTITAISAKTAGTVILLRFQSAIQVNHNATSLILLNGKNASFQANDVLILVSLGSANWYEAARKSNDFVSDSARQDFRLTLETGVPVSTSDQTAKTTVYATPYVGNRMALYDTTLAQWILWSSAEFSIALPATTSTLYDVFAYSNSGTLTLELVAWSSDTARATALVRQDGILCKTGDLTRRYLGSVRTTTVSGQTEDSLAKRYLWNFYHRMERAMRNAAETTNTWNYTTATWRQANAAATNQLDFVIGVSEDMVRAEVFAIANNTNSQVDGGVGIGLDSTSANSAMLMTGGQSDNAGIYQQYYALYHAAIAAGRHTLVWLERAEAVGTQTWVGDGGSIYVQSGMVGVVRN